MKKTFKSLVETTDIVSEILANWTIVDSKNDYVNDLNDRYGVAWSYESWSRYINTIHVVMDNLDQDSILVSERVALKLSQKQIQLEKTQLNKVYNGVAKSDYVYQKFVEYFEGLDTIYVRDPKPTKKPNSSLDRDYVFLADLHYDGDIIGMRTKLTNVRDRLLGELIEGYDTTIVLPGDLVQGWLRMSDMNNENWNPIQQMTEITVLYFEIFKDFKDVVVIPGNHDEVRVVPGQFGNDCPSLTDFFVVYGKSHGFNVIKTTEYDFTNYGQDFKVIHGHTFRSPQKIVDYYKYNPNIVVIHAHYHYHRVLENVIGLPALSEANDFEKSLGFQPNEPKFFVLFNNNATKVYDLKGEKE